MSKKEENVGADESAATPSKPATTSSAVLLQDQAAQTKAILAKKPHVNFIIPIMDGEAKGAYETVQINGYKLTIQKGIMVNIPMPVANLLAEKYRINMSAGEEHRIDRAPDVTGALA